MEILIDTNLLLRSVHAGHAQQAAAAMAINRCRTLGHQLVIVPQVLYEFWVVATRPIERNGLGWTPGDTQLEMDRFLGVYKLLRDERAIYDRWFDLVTQYDVKGKTAHDARLVAAMEKHSITHILTFNARDFERYRSIQPLHPDELLDETVSFNGEG